LGGAAVTEPVWPGYRVSLASYVCSLLDPQVVADLDLTAHGYHAYRKDPASFTPLAMAARCCSVRMTRPTRAKSPRSNRAMSRFCRVRNGGRAPRRRTLRFVRDDAPSFARFDAATRATLEGSVADLVERYASAPVLQATLATDGLIGTGAGPRDAGTAYVLAHHYAGRALGVQGAWGFVRGGMGAVSEAAASAARAAARRYAPAPS